MWNIGVTLGKSLIYIRKSNGLKIEPWGTDFVSDLASYHCNPHIDVYLKDIHEIIYFPTHTLHSNLTWLVK